MAEEQGITGALDRYNLDALVMPTFASFHLPAVAGLPVVTVPLGFYPPDTPLVKNLKGTLVNVAPDVPFGIAFVGRKWSEETLIALAYAFEQRTMARQKMKPYVRPSFELGDQVSTAIKFDPLSEYSESMANMTNLGSMQPFYRKTIKGLIWSWAMLGVVETLE